jgi:hypothetical protein
MFVCIRLQCRMMQHTLSACRTPAACKAEDVPQRQHGLLPPSMRKTMLPKAIDDGKNMSERATSFVGRKAGQLTVAEATTPCCALPAKLSVPR